MIHELLALVVCLITVYVIMRRKSSVKNAFLGSLVVLAFGAFSMMIIMDIFRELAFDNFSSMLAEGKYSELGFIDTLVASLVVGLLMTFIYRLRRSEKRTWVEDPTDLNFPGEAQI